MNFLEHELDLLEIAFWQRLRIFESLNYTQRLQLAIEVDFFQELQEAGLSKVFKRMMTEYGNIITDLEKYKTKGIAPYTIKELDLVARLDAEYLLGYAKNYAVQFKSSLIKGYVAGEDYRTIASRLQDSRLKNNQIIAAVTTAKDTYRAVSVAKLFEDEPETRFKLNGIIDDRNRCQCRAVLFNQPESGWTKSEIDAGGATAIARELCPKFEGQYSFIYRGGFNCRHYWEIV